MKLSDQAAAMKKRPAAAVVAGKEPAKAPARAEVAKAPPAELVGAPALRGPPEKSSGSERRGPRRQAKRAIMRARPAPRQAPAIIS